MNFGDKLVAVLILVILTYALYEACSSVLNNIYEWTIVVLFYIGVFAGLYVFRQEKRFEE